MSALEKHYTVEEIGDLWHLSRDTIRKLFQDEPGVLKIGELNGRLARKMKRRYISLRIPESVVIRVHQRLAARGRT